MPCCLTVPHKSFKRCINYLRLTHFASQFSHFFFLFWGFAWQRCVYLTLVLLRFSGRHCSIKYLFKCPKVRFDLCFRSLTRFSHALLLRGLASSRQLFSLCFVIRWFGALCFSFSLFSLIRSVGFLVFLTAFVLFMMINFVAHFLCGRRANKMPIEFAEISTKLSPCIVYCTCDVIPEPIYDDPKSISPHVMLEFPL